MADLVYPPVILAGYGAFAALGLKVRVHGGEHLPRTGGAVLASNHVSYLDFIFAGFAARPSRRLGALHGEGVGVPPPGGGTGHAQHEAHPGRPECGFRQLRAGGGVAARRRGRRGLPGGDDEPLVRAQVLQDRRGADGGRGGGAPGPDGAVGHAAAVVLRRPVVHEAVRDPGRDPRGSADRLLRRSGGGHRPGCATRSSTSWDGPRPTIPTMGPTSGGSRPAWAESPPSPPTATEAPPGPAHRRGRRASSRGRQPELSPRLLPGRPRGRSSAGTRAWWPSLPRTSRTTRGRCARASGSWRRSRRARRRPPP